MGRRRGAALVVVVAVAIMSGLLLAGLRKVW
jgi:hypothetical protein